MDLKWPQPNMDFYKKPTDQFNKIEIENSGVLEDDFHRYANNFYEAFAAHCKAVLDKVAETDKIPSFGCVEVYEK